MTTINIKRGDISHKKHKRSRQRSSKTREHISDDDGVSDLVDEPSFNVLSITQDILARIKNFFRNFVEDFIDFKIYLLSIGRHAY